MNCNQCEMLSINGVACHETGCPNSRKTWDAKRGEWLRLVECSECGYEYFDGDTHECEVWSDAEIAELLEENSEESEEA